MPKMRYTPGSHPFQSGRVTRQRIMAGMRPPVAHWPASKWLPLISPMALPRARRRGHVCVAASQFMIVWHRTI